MEGTMGLGNRVHQRRIALGLSQAALAEQVGISQQAIDRIENGLTKNPRKILFIARALKVSPDWLESGNSSLLDQNYTVLEARKKLPPGMAESSVESNFLRPPSMKRSVATSKASAAEAYGSRGSARPDLPILGQAQGGPDGNLVMDQGAIDWTWRPPALDGVEEAFAVFVTGSSMEPRYQAGDILYVHPKRPIRKGRHILVETTRHEGFIKRFEKWTEDELVLHQYNPDGEMRIKRTEVLRTMLVVGCMEG